MYPEARAAVAAARRANRIDEHILRLSVEELGALYGQLRIVGIDESLALHAGALGERHGLRGYEAVHLACALAVEGDDIVLATWDNALNEAARETGRLLVNRTA
jgi:predicted nucleic acid-binding protein